MIVDGAAQNIFLCAHCPTLTHTDTQTTLGTKCVGKDRMYALGAGTATTKSNMAVSQHISERVRLIAMKFCTRVPMAPVEISYFHFKYCRDNVVYLIKLKHQQI